MRKRFLIIITLLMMTIGSAIGQIVFTQEDAGLNPRATTEEPSFVMVPLQNVDYDQFKDEFVPLGEAWLLLLGLGGGYLIKKKWKVKSEK